MDHPIRSGDDDLGDDPVDVSGYGRGTVNDAHAGGTALFRAAEEGAVSILTQQLVFSRLPGEKKEYVQHRMEREAGWLAPLIGAASTHVFICGLEGMEDGVDAALGRIAALAGRDWSKLKAEMRDSGRYHIETY